MEAPAEEDPPPALFIIVEGKEREEGKREEGKREGERKLEPSPPHFFLLNLAGENHGRTRCRGRGSDRGGIIDCSGHGRK